MPLVAGELMTDDFRRNELSKTMGEPVLEEADRSMDWLLGLRSMGRPMDGAKPRSGILVSSSGNKENQSLELFSMGSP